MSEVSYSTFISLRLFSTLASTIISSESQNALVAAMSDDLSQMLHPLEGKLVTEKQDPLGFQFTAPTPQSRRDILQALECSMTLLHRLASFRFTRDAEEQKAWSFRVGIVTITTESFPHSSTAEKALTFAHELSDFAQPDQILIDQTSFQEIQIYPIPGWKLLESSSDYGLNSQVIYQRQRPDQPLSPELERKSFQLNALHIAPEDALCFYYVGIAPSHSIPVLRVYTPKPLPLPSKSSSSETSQPLEVIVGRYTLVNVLGVGGMGQVWRAKDTFGNSAAIKMMLPGSAAAEGQIERFRREAEMMSKLPHHNICRIFEVGESNNISYIAMELVEGITLHDVLHIPLGESQSKYKEENVTSLVRLLQEEQKKPKEENDKKKSVKRILPVEQTLSIIGKICDAIQFAHDHNILHRDLKPGNIMIREDGDPVVMDFGLGKLETDEKTKDLSLTMSGAMLGTMQYMSPEQAVSSHAVDSRADVYSIGAILYEMLTGQHHFSVSGSLIQDAQKLQDYQPPSPSSYNSNLEKDLEMVVLKALHPEQDRRYRTPAALRADLERYRHGEAVTAKPVTFFDVIRRLYRRNKPVTIVGFSAIFALFGMAIYAYVQVTQEKNAAIQAKALESEARTLAVENEKKAIENALKAEKAAEEIKIKEQEAVQARKNAEQALAELQEKQDALRKALEEKERAEFEVSNVRADAAEKDQLLTQTEEEKQRIEHESSKKQAELQQKIQKLNSENRPDTEADIEQLILTSLPRIKNQIGSIKLGDPFALQRIAQEISTISTRSPLYIEPRLLLGKTYFANGDFPEAFAAFSKVLEISPKAKDSVIQTPLAKKFFSVLQNHTKLDRDFFDETKGNIKIDSKAFTKSWSEISSEDAVLAKQFGDPSGKLSDGDRIAFFKFFSLLEQNP